MRELERPSPASDGPDGPVNSVGTALQNIFSMLHLREVQALKRRHLQRNPLWLHRYELKSTLCGHQGCVNTIHWSPEMTNTLVSGSDDMTVKLWRVTPQAPSEIKPMLSLSTCHRHNIFDAHLRGQQILSCGADGFVCRTYLDQDARLSDRSQQERLFSPTGSHVPMAFKMDFLQSQVFLVTFADGYVRHFDLREGGTLSPSSAAVNCDGVGLVGLAVEPRDGYLLALGGNDPFLRIYDLRRLSFHQESNLRNMITTDVVSLHSTAEMIRKQKKVISFSRFFSGQSDVSISGVSWDSCGRLLANYRGGDIELFDFRSELPEGDPEATPYMDLSDSSLPTSRVYLNSIRSYKGRINEQTCAKEVRFLCQGAAVASGGDCGHFYIWSTESTELLRKLPADRCVVNAVAAHPHLPLVATAGIEANIKAWDVDRIETFQGGVADEAELAESRELEEEGHTLMRQGAWVEAIGFFEAALNLLRNGAASVNETQLRSCRSCWMHMAFCHLNLEEYQAAIECCSRVLERGFSSAALLRRAQAHLALGRLVEAMADLEAAEEVEPENVEIPKLRSSLKKLKKRQSKESKESKSRNQKDERHS